MTEIWMKFKCKNCKKENWLHKDPKIFKLEKIIVYCCNCGYVEGQADHAEVIDKDINWLRCLPFKGFERKRTRGPVGPDDFVTAETLWGTAEGNEKEGLNRSNYMEKYGFDPWTDWCKRFPEKKICKDNGEGKSFQERCKESEYVNPIAGPGHHEGANV